MAEIRAWASKAAKAPLEPFVFDPGPLGPEDVEVEVEYCGLCHSDLSVLNDEWGISRYPFVPGHEAIGRVVALGPAAKNLSVGQRVGVGWTASSCMHCRWCLGGDQHLCPESAATIVGRFGAFAERVRAHWAWAVPIPQGLDPTSAGPLLCGGITVFAPLASFGTRPVDRVGVVGIGGLGHMALMFAAAWGCEVTAFTTSEAKAAEARRLGAHKTASTSDPAGWKALAGAFDLLIVTANASLDWDALIRTLRPKGRLHVVGVPPEPMAVNAFGLIGGQKDVAGSPTGAPVTIADMLEFCVRHGIAPEVEHFPMSRANDALARLASGEVRYRIVLDADFGPAGTQAPGAGGLHVG